MIECERCGGFGVDPDALPKKVAVTMTFTQRRQEWTAVVLFYLFICGLVLGLAIWFAIGWPFEAIKRARETRE